MEIKFFMRIEPEPPKVTHQQQKTVVRNGKPHRYEEPRLKEARALFTSLLAPHVPASPLDGPVYMESKWIFRKPKAAKGIYKTTKPDCDNLQKLLQDCMTALNFWHDDAQVMPFIQKFWADEHELHGVFVYLKKLPNQ